VLRSKSFHLLQIFFGGSGLQVYGGVKYNGRSFDEFACERAASYVEQTDVQIAELTVRDTLDFAARCQGTGHYPREFSEILRGCVMEKGEGSVGLGGWDGGMSI
jgi:ABC-type multidrug transport system ATPase subunit